MSAPGADRTAAGSYRLKAGAHELELGARPWLMGIVNASPDSFSDGGRQRTLDAQAQLAERLLVAGADIIDVGGESATTGRPAVAAEQEIERVVPLVQRVAGELGAIVSVDTFKPAVAAPPSMRVRGSSMTSAAFVMWSSRGVRATGAALVVMHTRAAPRERVQDADMYGDIAAEVIAFLRERMQVALGAGVTPEQLIVDPGPDFAKTPRRRSACCRSWRVCTSWAARC